MNILKTFRILAAAALLSMSLPASAEPASAPDLKDVLGGLGGALGNAVEGVFTKTDLTVEDIA